ncbi:RhoGAP domain-containing protein [Providencia sp. PROV252]|uniref:RhoGAP domain-containing protein n=1 Tax=Providencia sp. PROV252 TaxID=2936799 RepID=UPI00298FF242|nr:RhoGAP domain-containing protein [Providencia sp. PROV252]
MNEFKLILAFNFGVMHMSSLKIDTSTSLLHTNKEKPPEKIQNTSFIHSLKSVKNTVIQSIISTYHKLRFMLKQKLAKIEIVENPAYLKNTTASLHVPINNQYTENSVNQRLEPNHTKQHQKIGKELLTQQQPQRAQEAEQEKAKSNNISSKNIELIKQYADISEDDKKDFISMNKAISALQSNPAFIKQEGIFRSNGINSKISELLSRLADHPTLGQQLNTEQSFNQNELTGAIKTLRNKILTDHPKEKDKLDKLISTYKESINQENATKEYVANMPPDKRDKILQITKNNADKRLPRLQELPLHLQICMPLFVEVAKHSQENKMEPMNIAIAFGGGLHSTKRTIAEEKAFNKLNNEQQKELIKQETAHIDLANKLLMELINKQLK